MFNSNRIFNIFYYYHFAKGFIYPIIFTPLVCYKNTHINQPSYPSIFEVGLDFSISLRRSSEELACRIQERTFKLFLATSAFSCTVAVFENSGLVLLWRFVSGTAFEYFAILLPTNGLSGSCEDNN